MQKLIGFVTHEGRYVIIEVGDLWQEGDPLPPPSPDDRWFDTFLAFLAALNGPYHRTPIERQPYGVAPAEAEEAEEAEGNDRELKLEGSTNE